jgi:putative transposase
MPFAPATVYALHEGMPRAPRLQIPGLPQHVIQRGNNRSNIFRSDSDYKFFLTTLRDAAMQHQTDVHTYVLMTNHVHLLLTPQAETALSRTMKRVGQLYAQYFNRRYERTGALFEGRYRSLVIETEAYWFTCMRYVELNPVRAGLTLRPEAYRWSSHRAHALGTLDELIVPHPMYLSLGNSPSVRQQCWRSICGEALPAEQLAEIRDLVHRGGVLGHLEENPIS